MPIKGKYFPSQGSSEKVFLLIRRHWIIFFVIFAFVIILLIPVIILIVYWLANPDTFAGALGNFIVVFAGMYTLAVLGLLLYGFVNYYLDVYIVTNKRIVDIKQNGFFRREIAELHLHQVQDVEAKVEGFFQTLIHFGDIYIQTAGERENFIFEDVPHPYTLAKEIVELHEAQIESEHGPKKHFGHDQSERADDYRPEDYLEETTPDKPAENNLNNNDSPDKESVFESGAGYDIENSDGGIKDLAESYSPKTEADFERSFESTNNDKSKEKSFAEENKQAKEKEGEEFLEGQEIKIDDK